MGLKKEELIKINNMKEFYVRFREEKDKTGKIYYDGFRINDEEQGKISNNFFKFNCTNICNILKSNKTKELIDKMAKHRNKYFNTFRINRIKFEKSEYAKEHNREYQERMHTIEKQFNISYMENENSIKVNFDEIEKEFELLKNLWNIDDNGHRSVRTVLFKDINFEYEIEGGDLISAEKVKSGIEELTTFYEKYTKCEEEKKYQHLFLLNIKNNKNNGYLHKKIFGEKDINPFEEEYYIKYRGGRIDCIFYANEGDIITDIYLIELKVDEKVLGESNGIPTHLIDIEDMKKDDFNEKLLERINYRNYYINNDIENRYKYSDNLKTHFFVIIGRNRCSKEKLKKLVSDLNDKDSELYKKVKIKGRQNEPIKDIAKRIRNKDIDVKLFIDKNKWDCDGRNSFNPSYEEYEEAFKGE